MELIKRLILFLAAAGSAIVAEAQITITDSALTYFQNFDTLDSSGTASTNLPAVWSIFEWGGTSANTSYRAGTGSSTTGDTYSFGSNLSKERALGSIASSGVPNISYGLRFYNAATTALDTMTISFREEQWRRGGGTTNDTVRFYFSIDSNSSVSDTGFKSWVTVPALMMNSISRVSTAGAINGNDSFRQLTARVPVNVPIGGILTIRWHDFNSSGSDDGLAIDSLTVDFQRDTVMEDLGIVKPFRSDSLSFRAVNPAIAGVIRMALAGTYPRLLTIGVYSVSGRELFLTTCTAKESVYWIMLQTSLPAGTYIMCVNDGKAWGKALIQML